MPSGAQVRILFSTFFFSFFFFLAGKHIGSCTCLLSLAEEYLGHANSDPLYGASRLESLPDSPEGRQVVGASKVQQSRLEGENVYTMSQANDLWAGPYQLSLELSSLNWRPNTHSKDMILTFLDISTTRAREGLYVCK